MLRENEKLKSERGARKQFMYGGGAPTGTGAKFTPSMFGQTLLKGIG